MRETSGVYHCGECGFAYDGLSIPDAPSTFRAMAERIAEDLMSGDDAAVRMRPVAGTWSMLEYACHVRDTLLVQRERILLALVEDTPRFAPMYRDARVVDAGYDREARHDVVDGLAVGTHLLVKVVDHLSDAQLARRCIYGYPEPRERDVAWVIRHSVHELVHHEMDVRRVRTQLMDGDVWS